MTNMANGNSFQPEFQRRRIGFVGGTSKVVPTSVIRSRAQPDVLQARARAIQVVPSEHRLRAWRSSGPWSPRRASRVSPTGSVLRVNIDAAMIRICPRGRARRVCAGHSCRERVAPRSVAAVSSASSCTGDKRQEAAMCDKFFSVVFRD